MLRVSWIVAASVKQTYGFCRTKHQCLARSESVWLRAEWEKGVGRQRTSGGTCLRTHMDACDKEADLPGIRITRTDITMFHPSSFSRRGSTSHRQTQACLHGDHAPGHETQSMSLKEKKRALLSTACEHFLASTLDIPEAPILAWPILAHRQLHASAAGMQREAGVRSRPGQSVDARLFPPYHGEGCIDGFCLIGWG